MVARLNDVGAYLDTKTLIRPQSASAGTVTGLAIDRSDYASAVIHVDLGASTGSPTAIDVDVSLEESADNSNWSAVSTILPNLSTANSTSTFDIDLTGRKKYVRIKAAVAFTGGTTPAIQLGAVIVLGGRFDNNLPV